MDNAPAIEISPNELEDQPVGALVLDARLLVPGVTETKKHSRVTKRG